METTNAAISAAVTDSQIPSSSRNAGRISTPAHWNTSVRKKEMAADTKPLFSAVKKCQRQ